MQTQGRKSSFEGQKVYVGIDVHKKTWKASTCTKHTNPGAWTVTIEKPFDENLRVYLDKHFPGATFLCGYEAGFTGFWIHDALEAKGLPTIVMHAADIPTTNKEREQKEDRRDARKIAKALKNEDTDGIYVPSKQAQKDRSVVRERYSIAKNTRRIKVQIKSHLALYGIEIPEEMEDRHWSRNFIKWLEQVREENQDDTLSLQLDRLSAMRALQLKANRKLRELGMADRNRKIYEVLLSIPGVGPLTAMLLLTEIVEMKRFSSFRHLSSYTGFVPSMHSTGDKEVHSNITSRRNKHLRTALIESSWMAIRYDTELLGKYEDYRKRMKAQHAIVRIARILLRRIRFVWLHSEPYKKAIV
jgi:transposase